MKLGDILSTKSQAGLVPSVTCPVAFKVIGRGKGSGEQVTAEAAAVLAVVAEEDRALAQRDAAAKVLERYGETQAPSEALGFEVAIQVLSRALRDKDDPRAMFASADELRKALVQPVASRLYSQYLAYVNEEFPDVIDPATFERLIADAKKKSLVELLFAYGSSLILRVLPTLAIASGAPREPSTSATAPA